MRAIGHCGLGHLNVAIIDILIRVVSQDVLISNTRSGAIVIGLILRAALNQEYLALLCTLTFHAFLWMSTYDTFAKC